MKRIGTAIIGCALVASFLFLKEDTTRGATETVIRAGTFSEVVSYENETLAPTPALTPVYTVSFGTPEDSNEEIDLEETPKPTKAPQKKETAPIANVKNAKNRLIIPKIGVNAKVLPMGQESDGKMAVPDNYTDVGLYSLGPLPGQMGSAVMGAHVDNGGNTPGVFKNLPSMKIGDSITYVSGMGKEMTFKVTDIKVYDRNHKDTSEVFAKGGGAHLNLITCFGKWLPFENTYDKRIVIFSTLEA